MTIPHYEIIEVGGKNLVVFYPQFKDDEGYKIIDLENRFPIELKNEEEYKMFLEAIIASEDAIKDDLKTLADLIDEMSLLAKGPKGDTRYMWVKYADDAEGNGMSDNPDGKKYIGMAFNKDTETPSDDPSDYTWARYYPDLTDVRDELQTVKESINSHVNNKNNPHEVTKSQIGLGNVQNYGIASQSQAENGTSNSAYMTPLRTKQAIEKLLEDIGVVYVVESYEENGTFVTKYSDGKMEMTQYRNMGSVGDYGNGTLESPYRTGSYTWEFPETFVEEPVVLITPNADDSLGSRRSLTAYYRENRVNEVTYIQVASISDKFPSNDAYVNLLAIGRWK